MKRLFRFNPAPLLTLIALLSIAGSAQWLHIAVEHGNSDTVASSSAHACHDTDRGDRDRTPVDRHHHDCATCQMLALQSSIPSERITPIPVSLPICTALVPWSVEFRRTPHLIRRPARAPPTARG